MDKAIVLEDIMALVKQLPTQDKARLIAWIAPEVEYELIPKRTRPRKLLWGLWADLGPGPSADEIAQARREEWANFPREDI